MKHYHIYVFSQDGCNPCTKLKKYVETLPKSDQDELDFVPFKVKNKHQPYGEAKRTALAEELNIELTPTLVVVHEDHECVNDGDVDWCEYKETEVERIVGASNIIEHLDATLEAYTYAHVE